MGFDVSRLEHGLSDQVIADLLPHLPALDMDDYPNLKGYSWEQCHEGFMGSGGLFLVSELAERLRLRPGMSVLELGAGKCAGSVFIARNYGATAFAVDRNIKAQECRDLAAKHSVGDLVIPAASDVGDLPFPYGFFDAVIAVNSYLYFGTDDAYLPYLCKFLKPDGLIAIGSPCYSREFTPDTPDVLFYSRPDFIEARTCHSPGWWENHFSKTGLVEVLHCSEHPRGREFWLDDLRYSLLARPLGKMSQEFRDMIREDLVMLLSDNQRFVTYFTLLARKTHETAVPVRA